MNRLSHVVLLAAATLAGAGCGAKPSPPPPPPTAQGAAPAAAPAGIRFEECAASHGLDFRMRFLPNEQGEKFKINLYDHGCGVAVADYDGDGLDDVFFCNQLGPCALFRNTGGGSPGEVLEAGQQLACAPSGAVRRTLPQRT